LTTIHNMTDVAAARAYLEVELVRLGWGGTGVDHVPCKDILCMIIPEIDFCRSPNGDSSRLPIPSFQ
jgi:hypothetical protein